MVHPSVRTSHIVDIVTIPLPLFHGALNLSIFSAHPDIVMRLKESKLRILVLANSLLIDKYSLRPYRFDKSQKSETSEAILALYCHLITD